MRTSSSKALRLLPLLLLAACGGAGTPSAAYRPTLAAPPAPPRVANGAIFQVENGYAPLTSGTRASMVGDVITIALVERTQAAKSNSAGTSRSGSVGLTGPSTGPLDFFNPSDARASGELAFSGKGSAEQSNALSGEITVTVAEVYPNGTMLVRGEKLVTLNRGDEFIRISGLVRPQDVTADNRIASTRVADARITYSGSGEIAVASRQGWLQRFFSAVSPF
jgi:flagellar L-ring protein precursor FlgH